MRATLRSALLRAGLYDTVRRIRYSLTPGLSRMVHPPYPSALQPLIDQSGDPVRYAALALALATLRNEGISGAMAEVGVYKGDTSRFLRRALPDRTLYLFDTFEGFPESDLDQPDQRFQDTGQRYVARRIGTTDQVVFRQGYFPDTAIGLEEERFAFVLLDLDLFAPMQAGLEFFYPRLERGGFLVLHDYHNPESDFAVSRAADAFFSERPEYLFALPDQWGSVLIRKV
jgi:O-methyltransferase